MKLTHKLGFYIWATLLLVSALYHVILKSCDYHVFSRGSPDQLSTITASIPFWETHFERVENINGILRFIASICFLWRIGAIGSVRVASINIFVKRPPFNSVNLNGMSSSNARIEICLQSVLVASSSLVSKQIFTFQMLFF